jgi:hypothetical protein
MKLRNLAQPPNEYVDSAHPREQQRTPSGTILFPRSPATGEPNTLPTGICAAKRILGHEP